MWDEVRRVAGRRGEVEESRRKESVGRGGREGKGHAIFCFKNGEML